MDERGRVNPTRTGGTDGMPGGRQPADSVRDSCRHDDDFDGCPAHLPRRSNGQKYVGFDVAAWADLWFYSNPIYIEVKGSTLVAGVK